MKRNRENRRSRQNHSLPKRRSARHGQRYRESQHLHPAYEQQQAHPQFGRSEQASGRYRGAAPSHEVFEHRSPHFAESHHYPLEQDYSQSPYPSGDWRGDFRDQNHSGGWLSRCEPSPHTFSDKSQWHSIKESATDYYGIGPKGYRRSDERIREDACEALTHEPSVNASEIEVRVSDGKITLAGSVESRWMKRKAEDCVHELPGVQDVRNELEVVKAFPAEGARKFRASGEQQGAGDPAGTALPQRAEARGHRKSA